MLNRIQGRFLGRMPLFHSPFLYVKRIVSFELKPFKEGVLR